LFAQSEMSPFLFSLWKRVPVDVWQNDK
jgi:hypothetical protein